MTSSAFGAAVLLCVPLIGCIPTDDGNPSAREAPAGGATAAAAAPLFGAMHAAIPARSSDAPEALELH